MTRADALAALKTAGVPDASADLRRLERSAQTLPPDWFADAVARRTKREPMSHILGCRAFWKHDFKVNAHVLDPRPETERLIELALQAPFEKVLDLGCGSGAIVISLLAERPGARGVGTDISEQATLGAGDTAAAHGGAVRLILPVADWWDDVGGIYDLIVSNPPYIAAHEMSGLAPEVRDHEPRIALTDEADGLSAYRIIAARAAEFLRPGGRILLEIGPTQGTEVSQMLRAGGLEAVQVHQDLDGRDRVVDAQKQG